MRVFLFHLIFAFPGELGSSLGVPSNLHNGNATLFCSFDFSVHDFFQFFHEVETLVGFNLAKRDNESLVEQALLYFDTWKVGRTFLSSCGNRSSYASGPILARISNGPIYLGFNFLRLPKRIKPFQGETFKSTRSPTWNFKGFRRLSA